MVPKSGPEFQKAISHLQTAAFLLKEKKAKKLAREEAIYIINTTMQPLFWMSDSSWKTVRRRLTKYKLQHLLDVFLETDN